MTSPRTLLLTVSLLTALAACGSGDDSGSTNAPSDTSAASTEEPSPTSAEETAVEGGGTGTLTLGDGTEYALTMSTCDTSQNGAEGFLIPDSFDLLGRTSDGAFLVQIIRAGFDEESVTAVATLEGEFDDNGRNPQLLYSQVGDTMALVVDGGNVSGTVTMKPIGPNRPHGDEIGAMVDVRC